MLLHYLVKFENSKQSQLIVLPEKNMKPIPTYTPLITASDTAKKYNEHLQQYTGAITMH